MKLYHYLDPVSILFLSVVFFIAPVIILTVSVLMSSVYKNSEVSERNALEYWITHSTKLNGRLALRQLKSLQPIRSQVGGFYHMEAMAKLTLIDRIIQCVVFALLLKI